jgi:MFS transporter, MHS family, proline/betaine transporter
MKSRTRAIVAASVGNMLEWYDFTVYALFAAYVARNFFPPGEDAAANLLKAFLAFGLGFVVRRWVRCSSAIMEIALGGRPR